MKEQQRVDNEHNVPRQIMQHFTGLLLGGKLDQWAELFAPNATFEFPYSPPGYPQRLEGKSAIFNHVNTLFTLVEIQQFSEPVILLDADQQRFVAEFTCEGTFLDTGKPYNQTYISVVSYDGDKITHYRDYWNPLVVMESEMGGVVDEQ
ncbi:nuclear transport factor 2 family protein [Paenibacillus xylanexedens]|uniref:nuclear transport factor 2 family protein n=1 Tax=Paenibacillus xylanexedens TaxID=528191 RepID=UPI00119EA88F|nr:nuclear transport factor 2 family protein [Paenibacillus xylanexedens]